MTDDQFEVTGTLKIRGREFKTRSTYDISDLVKGDSFMTVRAEQVIRLLFEQAVKVVAEQHAKS